MKYKKKKGVSLILVVCMFAILAILLTTTLTVVTSGYQMRVKENKKIEDFYGADSGIEISYNLILAYLKEAVEAGESAVEKSEGIEAEGKNSIFKKAYKEFILEQDGAKFRNFINDEKNYKEYIKKGQPVEIKSSLLAVIKSNDKEPGIIEKDSYIEKDIDKIDSFKVYINSKFKDKDKNDREVKAEYEINIPDYSGELRVSTGNDRIPNIINNVIAINGDLDINLKGNGSNVTIQGDVWCRGKGEIRGYDRFEHGIKITGERGQNRAKIEWKGKIVTVKDIIIENCNVSRNTNNDDGSSIDIYGSNLKFKDSSIKKVEIECDKKEDKKGNESGSNEKEEKKECNDKKEEHNEYANLNVYNDTVIEGKENILEVKNYYGLNDINTNISSKTIDKDDKGFYHFEKSSSILMNAEDSGKGSFIKVRDDAYILGTSFLRLKSGGEAYKTGESMIINDNVKPYTYYKDGYLYEYISPLYIVAKKVDGDELEVIDKANIVNEYYKNHPGEKAKLKNCLAVGGNLYTAGAVFAKDLSEDNNVEDKKCITPDISKYIDKQSEYVKEVYRLGEEGNYTSKDFYDRNLKIDVNSSMDWIGVKNVIRESKRMLNSNEKNPYNGYLGKRFNIVEDKVIGENFVYLRSKKPINDYMNELTPNVSITDKFPFLQHYRDSHIGVILLNKDNSDYKSLNITSDNNKGDPDINTDAKEINCFIQNTASLNDFCIVISNGDVKFTIPPGSNRTNSLFYVDGDMEWNLDGSGTFGNFGNSDKEINDFFKYIFENLDGWQEIGDNVFKGGKRAKTKKSIDISELIDKKNWTIIK